MGMTLPTQKPQLSMVLWTARWRLLTELVCAVLFFIFAALFCSEEPVAGYYFVGYPDGVLYVSGVGIFFLPAISVVFVVNGIMLSIQIIRARRPKSFARR